MSKLGKISLLFSGFFLIVTTGARYILGGFIPVLYVFVGLFVLGLLLSVILDYKFYWEFLTAKSSKHSMSLGWSLLLALVLLVSVGYLGKRFDKTFDLTEEKINSLSSQSLDVLKSFEDTVYVRVFYKGDKISQQAKFLKKALKSNLALYRAQSHKVKLAFVDTYKDNLLASEYLSHLMDRDKQEVFVFVSYKDKKVRVTSPFTEQSITSAFIKARKRQAKEVYFLVGHGEKDLESDKPEGLGLFRQYLQDSGFSIKTWSFVQDGKPSTSPSLVLILGPRRPFLPGEEAWLHDYLSKEQGRVLLALDPGEKHNMATFLRAYGVSYKNNYILSRLGAFYGGAVQALGVYFDKQHSVTKKFLQFGKDVALFPLASAVESLPKGSKDFNMSYLVKSLDKSFVSNKLQKKIRVGTLNSFGIGMSVEEKKEKGFRLIVYGDSDFLTNKNLHQGVNRDLALNSVMFLADEEDLVSIRPKQPKGTKITMTRNHRLGLVVMVLVLPLTMLFASLWLWYRRREA